MLSSNRALMVLAGLMLSAFAAMPQSVYSFNDPVTRSIEKDAPDFGTILMPKTAKLPTLSSLSDPVLSALTSNLAGNALLDIYFDSSVGRFSYDDDVFRGTATPNYSRGKYVRDSQCHSSGCLKVSFGGRDDNDVYGMSGGWTTSFNLPQTSDVTLSLRFRIRQLRDYEANEYSEALISLDGALVGLAGKDYLARIHGNGNGGGNIDTGWLSATVNLGAVSAGSHTLTVGGHNNQKTARDEYSSVWFDAITLNEDSIGSDAITVKTTSTLGGSEEQIRFGVLGDFGTGDDRQEDVSRELDSWDLDFIITLGDNRYGDRSMDRVIGQYYCRFLADVNGGTYCPSGDSTTNAFFPAPGNHDYGDGGGIDEYLDYFTLPGANVLSTGSSGTEHYYDFIQGPIHFFALDSDSEGSSREEQQDWLKRGLEASTSSWKVVFFHHPPYSSSSHHGSQKSMQWPFSDWGADVVMASHDHVYERIERGGVIYFVNGLGGRPALSYEFTTPVVGSRSRYNSDNGAQRITATPTRMTFEFVTRTGKIIDSRTITQ